MCSTDGRSIAADSFFFCLTRGTELKRGLSEKSVRRAVHLLVPTDGEEFLYSVVCARIIIKWKWKNRGFSIFIDVGKNSISRRYLSKYGGTLGSTQYSRCGETLFL